MKIKHGQMTRNMVSAPLVMSSVPKLHLKIARTYDQSPKIAKCAVSSAVLIARLTVSTARPRELAIALDGVSYRLRIKGGFGLQNTKTEDGCYVQLVLDSLLQVVDTPERKQEDQNINAKVEKRADNDRCAAVDAVSCDSRIPHFLKRNALKDNPSNGHDHEAHVEPDHGDIGEVYLAALPGSKCTLQLVKHACFGTVQHENI